MNTMEALSIMRECFQLALQIALPLLLVSMIVGVVLAIFTAMTSINEQTLTFVPKLLSILGLLAVLGSTMLAKMQDFTLYIFNTIAKG